MLEALFWIAVGAAIGWNFPQPSWAKVAQEKIVGWFGSLFGKTGS
jgi:hypothetical protein